MDAHPTPYTYQQAAEALGIEAEAVRARLRRGALRRGPRTNDDRPTVLLSPADISTIRAGIRHDRPESDAASSPDSAGRPDERDRTIKALEDAIDLLREQFGQDRTTLEAAVVELKARAERAEMEASAERGRAERAETDRDAARAGASAERTRAAKAEAEREQARVQAAAAEGEVRGLRLALEEARRPFWRRWLG
jgi:hypothetical protein